MSGPVLIATPIRGAELWASSVSMGYAQFLRRLAETMPEADTIQVFSADTVRARNRIMGHFLLQTSLEKFSHILFVDDDNWPERVEVVQEMLDLDLDVVMAPCTNKRLPLRWCHQSWDPSGAPDERGCLEVRGVGMGFTMLSRKCVASLSTTERWYTDFPNSHRCPNLFGQLFDRVTEKEDETLLSEDYSFCKRARDGGFKCHIYVHAGIIYHSGSHAWSAREMPGAMR